MPVSRLLGLGKMLDSFEEAANEQVLDFGGLSFLQEADKLENRPEVGCRKAMATSVGQTRTIKGEKEEYEI